MDDVIPIFLLGLAFGYILSYIQFKFNEDKQIVEYLDEIRKTLEK